MKKFLVIQTAFIGDVILATCIVEKLANFYPNAEIDFLLRKGNESLLKNNPHVNKVFVWNKQSSKYLNLFNMIRSVRKEKYDYVINAHRFSSSGILTKYSGAQYKIGFDKNPLSKHFHYKISHKIGGVNNSIYPHETERCLKLVEIITDEKYVGPRIYPSEEDYLKIDFYVEGEYICISPMSVWETKQYPEKRWVEFLNEIKQYKVYLLGGEDDAYRCSQIAKKSEHQDIHVLAGELSLLQSAALMSKAKMNYVNDSAPMHLCSAMNAPVTAIYCSTIKEFGFGPLSDQNHIVHTPVDLNCRPCGLHGFKECPEGHFKCAKTIHTSQLTNVLKN